MKTLIKKVKKSLEARLFSSKSKHEEKEYSVTEEEDKEKNEEITYSEFSPPVIVSEQQEGPSVVDTEEISIGRFQKRRRNHITADSLCTPAVNGLYAVSLENDNHAFFENALGEKPLAGSSHSLSSQILRQEKPQPLPSKMRESGEPRSHKWTAEKSAKASCSSRE